MLVKQFVPYGLEFAYIRRRHGCAGYYDDIASAEQSGPIWRLLRGILPYGLVSLRDRMKYRALSADEQRQQFPEIERTLRGRMTAGERIRVLFLVSDPSMFPAAPLFRAMIGDPAFDPKVVAVPDFRHTGDRVRAALEDCSRELLVGFPRERVVIVRPTASGEWPDVLADADIVCYPTPHDSSSHRYCIRASAGRAVLPIHVNYGFYRSVYDRKIMGGENYARFWKVFFECEETMQEYARCSVLEGKNAELTGYVKMDALASVKSRAFSRKRILVALHHSVKGSRNEDLSLAVIADYADFFLSLPDRFPDVDFVFRPHPFLLETLSSPRIWGADKTARYFAELKSKPNVVWSGHGDYFRDFAESDGCIQDCGSYLVEYFYTGKPCCYMLKSPDDADAKFSPLGKKCLDRCYVSFETDSVELFIRDVVVGGVDPMMDERQSFARSLMVNYPHAADAALAAVRRFILNNKK